MQIQSVREFVFISQGISMQCTNICKRCDFCRGFLNSFFFFFFARFHLTFCRSVVLPEFCKFQNINIKIIYPKIRVTKIYKCVVKNVQKFHDHRSNNYQHRIECVILSQIRIEVIHISSFGAKQNIDRLTSLIRASNRCLHTLRIS